MTQDEPGGSFATLTHARLRAAQGDVGGALRILRVILAAQPDHREARLLLGELDGRVAITYREHRDAEPHPARAAGVAELHARFRTALVGAEGVARLRSWLERVRANRGGRRVR